MWRIPTLRARYIIEIIPEKHPQRWDLTKQESLPGIAG